MKTTYLVNQTQPDGNVRLTVVSSAEWLSIVRANKQVQPEERRYFIADYIADGNDLDCIIIEAPYEDYLIWNRERLFERRNRRIAQKFQHLSLNAPIADSVNLLEVVASEAQVEDASCDAVLIEELRAALNTWKPWANDLLDMYLQGKKRSCTNMLAQKYGVSPQVVRKYKRQFGDFVKNFLEGVSF